VGASHHHGVSVLNGRWALGLEVKHGALAGGAMLYDAARVGNLSPNWFDPKYWEARGELDGGARGRGTTHFVRSAGKDYVLRHYRRGALIARVSADRYGWPREPSTRPFEE